MENVELHNSTPLNHFFDDLRFQFARSGVVDEAEMKGHVLRFNLVEVEIRGLRPEVVAEGDKVLVHYRSRTNVRRRLSTKVFT